MKQRKSRKEVSPLRAHHVYCFHFADFSYPERGQIYEDTRKKIEGILSDRQNYVELKEGPDLLCSVCTYFDGVGCSHPKGSETAVKKWDGIILRGLGLKAGQVIAIKEVKELIDRVAPLSFCLTKCPYPGENMCNPRRMHEHLK